MSESGAPPVDQIGADECFGPLMLHELANRCGISGLHDAPADFDRAFQVYNASR